MFETGSFGEKKLHQSPSVQSIKLVTSTVVKSILTLPKTFAI